MTNQAGKTTRSAIMSRVRSKNTGPELTVRRALHQEGYRFRIHRSDLPGKPDLVFPRYRVAVFVHGCFWHRHGCKRSTMPKSNVEYWADKFRRNVERDCRAVQELEGLGWKTAVIWECDLEAGMDLLANELSEIKSTSLSTRLRRLERHSVGSPPGQFQRIDDGQAL